MQRTRLFQGSVLLMAMACMALCGTVLLMQYDRLVHHIVAVLQKPAIEGLLREKVLPVRKFRFIQYACGAVLVVLPLAAWGLLRKARPFSVFLARVLASIGWGIKQVITVYQENTRAANRTVLLVLVFVAVKSLWYIHRWDLSYDEMWCYNYFTARPFYVTPFAYNNYPLFELTTQLTKWLPFSMKINLRLPVVLTGLLACIVLYACLRRCYKSHPAALGGMVVFACMPVATIYMLYARGVVFELFFALIAVFSLLLFVRSGARRGLVLYALAHAAGMYSMPTHIYFWLLLLIAAALSGRGLPLLRNRLFLIANAGAAGLSVLLYLPVWIGSGLSFVVDATAPRYAYREIVLNIPAFIASYSTYYSGFPGGLACIAVLAGGMLLYKRQTYTRMVWWLVIGLCLLPLVIYLTQRMVIPYRASGFVALALPLICAEALQQSTAWLRAPFQLTAILLLAAALAVVSHFHHDLNWSRMRDREAVQLADLFLARGVNRFYDNSPASGFFYFYPALEYYYSRAGRKIDFSVAAPNSIRHRPLLMHDGYDAIVWARDSAGIRGPAYKEVVVDSVLQFTIWIK